MKQLLKKFNTCIAVYVYYKFALLQKYKCGFYCRFDLHQGQAPSV